METQLVPSVFGNIRQPQKRAFLRAYAATGRVGKAAEAIGMSTDIHYHWLKDEAYAEAFQKAQMMAGNKFEDEVYRRAFEGDERPIVHKGKKVGSYRLYSDLLAIFALKGIFPEKYRDNSRELVSRVRRKSTSQSRVGKNDNYLRFLICMCLNSLSLSATYAGLFP